MATMLSQVQAAGSVCRYPEDSEPILEWAKGFLREESEGTFRIGVPDFPDRPALVAIIEAARALCGLERARALENLRTALDWVENGPPESLRNRS